MNDNYLDVNILYCYLIESNFIDESPETATEFK